MENKEFIINITEEQANYLQRLGNEVDSKVFLLDRMFANHMNDKDIQMFNSVPYKHYIKEYEKAHLAWETAKAEFEKNILFPAVQEKTGLEKPLFNWQIDDYVKLECKVTLV